ncbi:MAG: FHA domain-containing protein, partial [Candidatus Firestonebacteria bacterium]
MNRIVKYLLLVIMVLCVGVLIYIYRFINYPFEIKPYEESIKLLVTDVIYKCEKKGWKGTISEIKSIKGPVTDDYLDSVLVPEITVKILESEKKVLTFIIPPDEYQQRIKELKKLLTDKGVPENEVIKTIMERTKNAKYKADYDIEISWSLFNKEKQHIQIIFKVSKEEPIESHEIFTYPIFEQKYNKKMCDYKLTHKITLGVFCLAFLAFISSWIIMFIKGKLVDMGITKDKLEDYLRGGHFLAAESLVNQTLNALPNNTDLLAFKERLMIVTKSNPRRADEAYIRYINIMMKLKQQVRLTKKEFENFKKLPQYLELPEITEAVAKYEKHIRLHDLINQLEGDTKNIKKLIESGDLSKAKTESQSLLKSSEMTEYERTAKVFVASNQDNVLLLPSGETGLASGEGLADYREKVGNFSEEIAKRGKESKEMFEEAKNFFKNLDIESMENVLQKVVKINKDFKEAEDILDSIRKSKNTDKLCLVSKQTSKKVYMLKNDIITFGCKKDDYMPDVNINNPRISRKHLKLCIIENNVIAEDDSSANGTYYGSDKITKMQLEDGDILDLAHSYKIVIHILRGSENVSSTMVDETMTEQVYLNRQSGLKGTKVGGLFIECDDRYVIVILDIVPMAFTKVGI